MRGRREGRNGEKDATARRTSVQHLDTKKGAVRGRPPYERYVTRNLAAGNLARLEAARADVGLATVTVDNDRDALDVGLERAVHHTVGVADGMTGNGVLAAELTDLGHARTSSGARRSFAPATFTAV